MPKRPPGGLTIRERAFVSAFLGPARGNATQAALLAGYSPKTAGTIGSQNLQKLEIAKAVEKAIARGERAAIANAAECDELATGFLRNPFLSVKERMRAMAELNKVSGRHVLKHKVELTLAEALGLAAELEKGNS
jgi:hypothetical protein